MRRILQFLSDMDAQAWRMLLVSFLLFGGVGLVFVFGAQVARFLVSRKRGGRLHAGKGGGLQRHGWTGSG